MNAIKTIAICAVAMGAGAVFAQNTGASTQIQNVLQISASGTVESQQDLLAMSLQIARDGSDAAAVQGQLRSVLDAALLEARKDAQPGQLDVRTGHFSLSPRYSREGKINGWQGSAELLLEGRDFARITRTAGRINTMTVGSVGFALSREQQAKSQAEAQALAIENFKQKAQALAKSFGFSGYTLREVSVQEHSGGAIRPRMMAAEAKSFSVSDASVPVEAGKTNVTVSVSGSLQLIK